MIKQNIFTILFFFYSIISWTQTNQYDKNWMIGYGETSPTSDIDGAQIIFEKDSTFVLPVHKDYFMEASTVCLSDSTGKLLYYSGGCTINNFKHKTMVKGDSMGKGIYEKSYCEDLNNSAIIGIQMLFTVPHQANSNWYYFFSLNLSKVYTQGTTVAPTKLYYSIIDMSKNNGEGEVIVKHHEILTDTFSNAMIQGVRHKNKKDWWIIMPQSRSNCYFVVLIDSKGVAKITKLCGGIVWNSKDGGGQAVFSPNRKYYARLGSNNNNLNLFDFNNETGILKAKKILYLTDTLLTAGVAFSPNSRYLYAMCNQRVYQYDIKAEDIEKSKITIAKLIKSPKSNYKIAFCQSMLAPDGKIYIAGQATHDYLHVIHKPNLQGLECNLEQYSLKLPCYNGYGLPNMPHFKDWEEDTSQITSISDFEEKPIIANVYPNPTEDELSLDLLGYINQYQNGQMQLYNTQGQNVLSFPLLPEHDEYRFDISTLQNGLYIWNLVLDGKVKKIGKIIKME